MRWGVPFYELAWSPSHSYRILDAPFDMRKLHFNHPRYERRVRRNTGASFPVEITNSGCKHLSYWLPSCSFMSPRIISQALAIGAEIADLNHPAHEGILPLPYAQIVLG